MAVNSGDGGPKAVRKRGEKHRLQPRTARNVQISACHGPSARDDLVAAKLITLDNEVIFAFCNLVRFGPRAVRTKSRRDSDLVPWVSMFTRHEQRRGGGQAAAPCVSLKEAARADVCPASTGDCLPWLWRGSGTFPKDRGRRNTWRVPPRTIPLALKRSVLSG